MNIEEHIEFIDNEAISRLRKDFSNDYSFLIDNKIIKNNPITIDIIINKSDNIKLIKLTNDRKYEYQYWRKVELTWIYDFSSKIKTENEKMFFKFWIVGYINLTSKQYGLEIIDEVKYHLKKLQDIKQKTIRNNELICLYDYRFEFIDDDIVNKFTDIIINYKIPHKSEFNDYYAILDLVYKSKNMLNIISEMILLKNYTYDIKKHKTFFSNKEIYTYFPTFYDTNYYFYSSMFIQLIFNYYEAISQILFVFFDFGNLKKDKVGFSIIIDKLYEKYENDVSIKFIFEYKENEYKNLNEKIGRAHV